MSAFPIEVVVPLVYFGSKGMGLVTKLVKNRRLLRAWRDVAGACGLQVLGTSIWGPRLTARAGSVTVTIDGQGSKGRDTRIDVRFPVPPDVHQVIIRRRTHALRAGEIEIGDAPFDKVFVVKGPLRQVLSLLDAERRRQLIYAHAESRVEISAGAFRAAQVNEESLARVLPRLLHVGWRFAHLTDIPRRLADNVKADPEAGVRLQNLLCLIRELPEAPETHEALRTACADASPEVRLQAAKGLGAEGRDDLQGLTESRVDDAVRAEAVSALERELPFERTKAILDDALDRYHSKTACACLEALCKSGDAAAVDELGKALAREPGELAAAAAQALGATGSPAAEPALLLALQRQEADLRVAVAHALGRVGTAAAVLPLQEAAGGSWLDREWHRAVREEIAEIQSRLHGASPGQLSLPDTEAGQLSLAQAEAGQLSIAERPAGQLSMAQGESELPHRAHEEPAGAADQCPGPHLRTSLR
jgi:HEAT repeat protein